MIKLIFKSPACIISAFLFILIMDLTGLYAQPAPSFSVNYDFLEYNHLKDPDANLKDSEIRVGTLNLSASYPIIFSKGKTVFTNEIAYQRFDIDYKKFPVGALIPEHVYAVKYNMIVMHTLSQKWSLLGFLTPGLASDFKADLSIDDFTLEAVMVFIRKYSPNWSVGYGAAFTTTFGQPFPVPVLAIDWNNGSNMQMRAILPVDIEFWYRPGQRLFLGLSLKAEGNQYHGDPDIYGVNIPMMRYSVGTFGPSVKFYLAPMVHLKLDAGATFLRRFEFFDNDEQEEVYEYKINNTIFGRIHLQIGG